tara:strand:+ start:132 stop:404 length:273 start_codon:yes stop_codon:yes gene_type:complete
MNITDLSFDIQEILERKVLHNQILNRIHKKQLILHKELVECFKDASNFIQDDLGIFDGQYHSNVGSRQNLFEEFVYEIDIHSKYEGRFNV